MVYPEGGLLVGEGEESVNREMSTHTMNRHITAQGLVI